MLSQRASRGTMSLAILAGLLATAPTSAAPRVRLELLAAGLPASGQWRQGFAVADLDGDGDLDLAHGPPRAAGGGPRLFLNDGRGRFLPAGELRLPDLPYDYGDAAAADFDGDGRTDLALGIHLRGVGVLLQDGSGGFARAAGAPAWTGDAAFPTVAIDAADWDGDGRPDLLALSEGPRPGHSEALGLRIFLNLESGWRRIEGGNPGALFGDGLAVGDFDGDGRPDVAAASRSLSHRGQVLLGRGSAGWEIAGAPPRPSAYIFAVAACDVDGDGRDELTTGFLERRGDRWRQGVDLLDLADGRWTRTPLSDEAGEEAPRALACADLDRDGDADLVAGSTAGDLAIFEGEGRGRFRRPRRVANAAAGTGCAVRHLELADLDGDGRAELMASFAAAPGGRCRSGGALKAWRMRW